MLKEILCFGVGAACGCVGTYLVLKNRYETMAKEADEAAMDFIKKRTGEKKPEETMTTVTTPAVVRHEDATNYNKIRKEIVDDGEELGNRPYRIDEEDFVVDDMDYDRVSLEYYTDGESLFEGAEYIPNVEDVVGEDNIAFLHGSEEDVIYVRNDDLQTDYEISKIVGRYGDMN